MARVLAVLAGGTAVSLGMIGSPAVAAPAAPVRTGTNCVITLGYGGSGSTMDCYGTFTEAVSQATGGAVDDAPAVAATALRDRGFLARIRATNAKHTARRSTAPAGTWAADPYTIGIEYDETNYGGYDSLLFTGVFECSTQTDDNEYQINLPQAWWDRVSSFENFSNCWTNHFFNTGYGEPQTGYLGPRRTMPVIGGNNFNNHARSLRWS